MAYKSFAAGEVFTASDVNTYLMRQSVIVCTSSTRPATPTEGMMLYETDTDFVKIYNGATWETTIGQWTATSAPTFGGTGWAYGNATNVGEYLLLPDLVIWREKITMGGSTTFGAGNLEITAPVSPSGGFTDMIYGQVFAQDVSTGQIFGGFLGVGAGSGMVPVVSTASGYYTTCKTSAPFAWVSTDIISLLAIYRRAA